MSIITLENVSVQFANVFALKNISLQIEKGEYIGLIGPNGAGKSTFLKTILGMIPISAGKISVDSSVRFGYVPQNYLPQHFFSISVQEVLEMGLNRFHFFRQKNETAQYLEKLQDVGLSEDFLKKSFHSLSGGQKQRVIIARSLLCNPNVLLFDEPLSGVDYLSKLQIYDLLATLNMEKKMTILFVSHEIESVISKCKKILCLNTTLHHGCHPVHFMKGDIINDCHLPSSYLATPIHHHHSLSL